VTYDDLVATLTPTMPEMGTVSPLGAGRQAVENAITSGALTPRNDTAIGEGMIAGAAVLTTVQTDTNYPTKAMVVMTDGNENAGPSVTDATVTSAIAWFSDNVYAIGLGAETNVSAATLGAIARYQLITGNITANEQRFLLTKYFLQILAVISDSAIVVDPQGELRPGDEHRIPFDIGECDVSMDVVAICPIAPLLDLTLEAPDGTVIHAGSGPNVALQIDAGDEFYRVQLPAIPADAAGTHAGRWTAILRIRDLSTIPRTEAGWQGFAGVDRQALTSVAQRGALPYQMFVQSYSNLRMTVDVHQDGFLPGAKLTLLAGLLEYRRPVAGRARVMVEVTEPDGSEVFVSLAEVAPGRFRAEYTTIGRGIYRCRFRANGTTRAGQPFQREETRTAAINSRLAPGGDLATTSPPVDHSDQDRRRWCALVECLLHEPSIARVLNKLDVDPREIEACLKRYCSAARATHAGVAAHTMEGPMSEETERLLNELTALRIELSKKPAFDIARWNELLAAAPVAKAVPPPPPRPPADDTHAAHHNRALPALVTDDDGTTRVILPGGGQADHGAHNHDHGGHQPGGKGGDQPGAGGSKPAPDHPHGDDDPHSHKNTPAGRKK
jgi:hypothetical protein